MFPSLSASEQKGIASLYELQVSVCVTCGTIHRCYNAEQGDRMCICQGINRDNFAVHFTAVKVLNDKQTECVYVRESAEIGTPLMFPPY